MFQSGGPTFVELLVQAFSSTERGYDLLAPKFDLTPFRTPDAVLEVMADEIGPPSSIDAALDVCCGTGAAIRWLRPICRERVVGLDFSKGMLGEASHRVSSAEGGAAIDLVQGNALAMPFDAEFDVVTCVGAFGHVLRDDEDAFVAGIVRALRPGGRFVFVTTEPPSIRASWWWLAHGFNGVMRIRNAIVRPEFIMYYLTFQWPAVRDLLERHGLRVEARRGLCPAPFEHAIVVVATREK